MQISIKSSLTNATESLTNLNLACSRYATSILLWRGVRNSGAKAGVEFTISMMETWQSVRMSSTII